jgi:type I restriction enzyme S subunit
MTYLDTHKKLVLESGDILMALNRPILGGQLKIAVLNDEDAPAILYQRVGRFDFYHSGFELYVYYFAQSPVFLDRLIDLPLISRTQEMS